jgi:hypothetical protein
LPGTNSASSKGRFPPLAGSTVAITPAFAVPIDLVKLPPSNADSMMTLAKLAATGQFVPPLQGQDQVGFGSLALGLDKKNGTGWPRDPKDEFHHSDGQIILFISWNPKTKFKGIAVARFYNLDNHEVTPSEYQHSAGFSAHHILARSAC